HQTIALLKSARQLYLELPADVLLLVVETPCDWDVVRASLHGCRLLIASPKPSLVHQLRDQDGVTLLDLEPDPRPIEEKVNLALLKAVANEQLQPGSHIVLLYNGIAADTGRSEPSDSLIVIHHGEHM